MEGNVIEIILQVLTLLAVVLGLWHSIRKLAADFDAKIDRLDERLGGRIDKLDAKFDGQIAALGEQLGGRIDKLDAKFDGQIAALGEQLGGRIDKLDAKLSGQIAAHDEQLGGLDERLGGRIDKLDAKFDGKIDRLGGELRTEIRGVRTELTARIDAVQEELVNTRLHLSDRVSRLEGAVSRAIPPRTRPKVRLTGASETGRAP